MKQKEVEKLPIRTIIGEFGQTGLSRFGIDKVKPDEEGSGVIVEAHRHDYYHIMYIKRGSGVHSIDFKHYVVKPGSLFFVSPGQVHTIEIDKDVEAYVISFNSDFYLFHNNEQKLMDYPFFHTINNDPVVYFEDTDMFDYIIKEMLTEYNNQAKGTEKILQSLMEILLVKASRMYTYPVKEESPVHLTFQLRKLETLIDKHFREYKLLNDYADLMYISPKHLNSLCKKGLNKTVTNLIHERTLTEAKRLLLFTDNSIAEIAFELGFADKSYFMRFFKKQTTQTADTFRNSH